MREGATLSRHAEPLFGCVTGRGNTAMSRIRRGGYVFVTWAGDHGPKHVHVYRDSRLVLKWDLEAGLPTKGVATTRMARLIRELVAKGAL